MQREKTAKRKEKNGARLIGLRLAVSVLLPAIALLLQKLAHINRPAVEHYYSRRIYLYIASALSQANRLFSFSAAEFLLIGLVLGIVGLIILQIYRLIKKRVGLGRLLGYGLMNLTALIGVAALLFLFIWGFNYERMPLASNLNWKKPDVNADELEKICRLMIEQTNRNYEEAHVGSPFEHLPMPKDELYRKLEESYRKEELLGEASRFAFGPPKPALFSRAMSYLQISGVYAPFTGEPNFNAEQPAFEQPYTMAHEKAHQRGIALENEANFIAFLICIKSDHPFIRYSGYLLALDDVLNNFSSVASKERYREVYLKLGDGPKRDYAEMRKFWGRYSGRVGIIALKVNDAYLKSNLVASGAASYNEVVSLIVSYYANQQGIDVKAGKEN